MISRSVVSRTASIPPKVWGRINPAARALPRHGILIPVTQNTERHSTPSGI